MKKCFTHIIKDTPLEFLFNSYSLRDSTKIIYDTAGNVVLKTQNRYINNGIFNKTEKYSNDSLIQRQFEMMHYFSDSNCNYAEFHKNGIPKYVKMSYCGEDTLITKYDSIGEETYREEIYVDGRKVKRHIYLYSTNGDRYFAQKTVCKRRRCKGWQYNDKGILISKKRYRLSKGR